MDLLNKKNKMENEDKKILYLRQWLFRIIVENPEILDPKNPKQTPVEIYAHLQTLWLKDIQIAMKSLLREIINLKEE